MQQERPAARAADSAPQHRSLQQTYTWLISTSYELMVRPRIVLGGCPSYLARSEPLAKGLVKEGPRFDRRQIQMTIIVVIQQIHSAGPRNRPSAVFSRAVSGSYYSQY